MSEISKVFLILVGGGEIQYATILSPSFCSTLSTLMAMAVQRKTEQEMKWKE
jgi:hypothetical protein